MFPKPTWIQRALAITLLLAPFAAQAATTAIRFGTLVDGKGGVRKGAVVVVDGERIVDVVTSVPAGATVIDLSGYTGVPGLIDVHTHMTYSWDPDSGTRPFDIYTLDQHPAVTVFKARKNATRTLEAGVTTVRDLGGSQNNDIAMRDLINDGSMIGPRMFVSGVPLHVNYASSRPHIDFPYPGIASGAAEVMRVVRQEIMGAGADWVKMFGSTGSGGDVSTRQTFTFDEMKAAADAAHALGVRIAIHSYGLDGAHDAVFAGANSVEHAVELDDATLAEMKRRGTYYVRRATTTATTPNTPRNSVMAPRWSKSWTPSESAIWRLFGGRTRRGYASRWGPMRSSPCSARTRANSAGSCRRA